MIQVNQAGDQVKVVIDTCLLLRSRWEHAWVCVEDCALEFASVPPLSPSLGSTLGLALRSTRNGLGCDLNTSMRFSFGFKTEFLRDIT